MTRSRDIADQQENLGGPVTPFIAGKNKVINGDFGVWQRGTSFSADGYTSDRWRLSKNAGTTVSVSRQAFTVGAAPVAPYESQFFSRYQRTAGAFDDYFLQRVEDARTFANVTTTLSFWAKASANTTISQVYAAQTTNGTGGGGAGAFGGVAITTSWARYTVNITLASLSGATFGAGNYVELVFKFGSEMGNITVDLWGVQWEAGSVATPFTPAGGGSQQAELALCQRYLPSVRCDSTASANTLIGYAYATNQTLYTTHFPVQARVAPTGIIVSGTHTAFALNTGTNVTPSFNTAQLNTGSVLASPTITAGQGSRLEPQPNAFILFTGCEL